MELFLILSLFGVFSAKENRHKGLSHFLCGIKMVLCGCSVDFLVPSQAAFRVALHRNKNSQLVGACTYG